MNGTAGTAPLTPRRARAIARAIAGWYLENRRDLPWRRSRDPYAIWVSEIMLQQTQVATVVDYYQRWMDRFPTLDALADADEAAVLHAWQGLGYYSRARNLWRGARSVRTDHGGRLPATASELRQLPGVGPYSAGAIASIAYDEAAPIVDGNVARVLCRLFALPGDPSRNPSKGELWRRAEALVVSGVAPSDLNQGLMELGATVCTPRSPACPACPLSRRCSAKARDDVEAFPETRQRPRTVRVRTATTLVRRRGRTLVVQLGADARRWAGLWQFPTAEVRSRETSRAAATRAVLDAAGLVVSIDDRVTTIHHTVTHHRIEMEVFEGRAARGRARPLAAAATAWETPAGLESLAMPAAHRRVARLVATES